MTTPYHRLKKLRRAAGLTLLQAAQRAGISESYLWKIEEGYVQQVQNHRKHRRVLALEQWLQKRILQEGAP